ncbi:hypothetical protein [Nocardia sp. SC052]|uniref:hypothetical protein n=1 Tax=Nocardia sichangensis TaxID=3385975 RepID=UPI0039A07B6F
MIDPLIGHIDDWRTRRLRYTLGRLVADVTTVAIVDENEILKAIPHYERLRGMIVNAHPLLGSSANCVVRSGRPGHYPGT